ncbi:MAG: pyridoxal phosphate-dependent aminotransferase, partial [Muribaculaceae bacterium]
MADRRILLCLVHIGTKELEYIHRAFEGNWVVPLGPDVNAFEDD